MSVLLIVEGKDRKQEGTERTAERPQFSSI